jgi:hypothetical protein
MILLTNTCCVVVFIQTWNPSFVIELAPASVGAFLVPNSSALSFKPSRLGGRRPKGQFSRPGRKAAMAQHSMGCPVLGGDIPITTLTIFFNLILEINDIY